MVKLKAHARDKEIDQHIGRQVRAIRQLQGMTQTMLGEHLGVSFQQIQKYERGNNRISASSLVKICIALDIHPMEVLGQYFHESDAQPLYTTIRARLNEAEDRLAKIHRLSGRPVYNREAYLVDDGTSDPL